MIDNTEYSTEEGKDLMRARLEMACKDNLPVMVTTLELADPDDPDGDYIAHHVYSGLADLPNILYGVNQLARDFAGFMETAALIQSVQEGDDPDEQ